MTDASETLDETQFEDPKGRVLIIAGSDSGGGAGIQADLKTVTLLGGFGMTAITAITAQDTTGVHGVWSVALDAVQKQMIACLTDIGADAVKTGMLGTAALVECIAETLDARARDVPRIVDPVMRLHLRLALGIRHRIRANKPQRQKLPDDLADDRNRSPHALRLA